MKPNPIHIAFYFDQPGDCTAVHYEQEQELTDKEIKAIIKQLRVHLLRRQQQRAAKKYAVTDVR
jgi:hypothetical protein